MSNNLLEPWLLNHSPCGFIDPWSLAARQQKAVLEQAHRQTSKPSSSSPSRALPSDTRLTTPPIVGWPPVCAYRKNMAMTSHATRPDVDGEREAKRAKLADRKVTVDVVDGMKGAMFVKVNMEGYAVGRKVDLKAHDSYDSLSCSLKKMFNNFLSIDCSSEEELRGKTSCVDFLLLYEDHEGDRMLVGDVPWDMFLSSVKRLYIVRSPKGRDRAANVDAGE
ncbi:hypothetical protein HPP92_004465 [Vanilla planifolia]|uniref:Auxin-responsive protein n=1 Tax=Vanilla planifolia TaxID=51239 RepID=A0A835RWW8_VANPL|nr:hypothetical protein HPP92_004465 [Vanilla planifolia]